MINWDQTYIMALITEVAGDYEVLESVDALL
jgi:hypothetical protein